jgi:hypothetical protein
MLGRAQLRPRVLYREYTEMKKAMLFAAMAGALGLGVMATSATAAPVSGVALRTAAPAALVEKVHRRCYWHHGHRHCRRHHHHHHRAGLFPFVLLPFIALALAH